MKAKILFVAVASAICSFGADEVVALGYQTPGKKGGLSFLVKEGNGPWEHAFHKDFRMTGSNLGNWGEKEVQEPFVVRDGAGAYHLFHCFRARPAICHEESWNKHNLRNWGRENWIELPDLPKDARATGLVVESARDAFVMLFTDRKSGKAYKVRTDGKVALCPCEEIGRGEYDAARSRLLKVVEFGGATYTGGVVGITKEMREFLKSGQDEWHKSAPWHLTIDDAKDDEKKYSEAAKNAKLKLRIEPANKAYAISPMLVGAFFEDINSCADGGIVAELVQNGDFEYSRDDCWDWHPLTTWETKGGVEARTDDPVHANNAHYIRLQPGAEIANMGWGEWKDGKWQPAIFVEKGKKYDVSAYVRGKGKAIVKVNGREIALAGSAKGEGSWRKASARFVADATSANAVLTVVNGATDGDVDVDCVSLMPVDTYKGHGLRKDLAEAVAAMKPKFLRFPGGCIVHGWNVKDGTYRWKDTVGAYPSRKGKRNMWGGRQAYRLGFYEYFQFCEDVGMEPVPIVSAGVSCPNPLTIMDEAELAAWVQDTLDLVDFAKGDPKKSKWARLRAEMGHPKPFKLNYIGLGNEDDINIYFEHGFSKLQSAIKAKDPSIKIVGSAGPTFAGRDYEEGWKLGKKLKVEVLDEHYYVGPGWFYGNQHFYDDYDRKGPKVYAGEYAAHKHGRVNDMETALACAIHLCNLERNGDVVAMASYAPLFGKREHCRWSPDLIYFNNQRTELTTDYWTQWIFGNNAGDKCVPSKLEVASDNEAFRNRFAASVVKGGGKTIVKVVNSTPFPMPLEADLSPLGVRNGTKASVTLFAGRFDDQSAKPVTRTETLAAKLTRTLPPNSLTVLVFK